MNLANQNPFKPLISLSLGLGIPALLASCAQVQSQQPASITIDGSSTVYPITEAVAEQFQSTQKNTPNITVDFSGTGGGFEKFCAGKTDISNASRPIKTEEIEACRAAGVRYIELPIAFDALTVVANLNNDWLESITVEELKTIWQASAEGKITRWNQVREDFPDRPLNLFGPGSDSGTFDYFTEAILDESGTSRGDYVTSEDDEILVRGVSQDPNALGYFGFAYYEQHQDQLKAVAIDSGKGTVLPSRETVEKAKYQPLARPLFIYVNSASAQDNDALKDFIDFYLDRAPEIVGDVGYIPLPQDAYRINFVRFNKGEVGTVFEGKSQFDLTISELLQKQREF
ncbi:PstS family phosphate ABC transporter substrate-binding protein [Lusitaniella coriacea LEGE 07157]|uniref:Phosphate-binding protein n=1 Tax=Lusitaniella coriacea LEGE 07157 TaxID=945747 RepID=A0A8J7E1Z8_9CYAN|nr:PstS family phosphate ABC transporter substrate-binding protein [Lusitaniella coriacea]MBE9118893.1 PstS family phosphate ABC transporter substrate-binding protein [Lusitaniella coriacea LEGE 07157]